MNRGRKKTIAKSTEQPMQHGITALTKLYLFLMLAVFPLFYNDGYLDILRAKKSFFIVVSIIYLAGIVLLAMFFAIRRQWSKPVFSVEYRWMIGFALCCMISWIVGWRMCSHPSDALWGETGRYLGVSYFVIALLVLFAVSFSQGWDFLVRDCMCVCWCLVYLIQIVNQWGMDPLDIVKVLRESDQKMFLSTMGQMNFNACFNLTTVVLLMGLFLFARHRMTCILEGITLFLGFCGSLCCRSNSVYIGIVLGFVILLGFALQSKDQLKRLWVVAVLFWAANFCIGLLKSALPMGTYPFDSIAKVLTGMPMLASLELVLLLWGVALFYQKKEKEVSLADTSGIRRVQKIYFGMMCAIVGLVFLLFVVVNVAEITEGTLSVLYLTDAWGNRRGYIWTRSVEILKTYSPMQILFGCGLNQYSYVLKEQYGTQMQALFGANFIDAHSEYLQILMSTGIVGFFGYFGMIVTVLVANLRRLSKNPKAIIPVVSILCFLAQGVVNNPQVTTIPFLFIGLGYFLRDNDSEPLGI